MCQSCTAVAKLDQFRMLTGTFATAWCRPTWMAIGNQQVHGLVRIETRRSLHHQVIMLSLTDANRGSPKHRNGFAADCSVGNAIPDLRSWTWLVFVHVIMIISAF
jgi:hypothetical protein